MYSIIMEELKKIRHLVFVVAILLFWETTNVQDFFFLKLIFLMTLVGMFVQLHRID